MYNFFNSCGKLVYYIGNLSKEKIIYSVDNQIEIYEPPKKVVISQNFFRTFKCNICSKCCSKVRFYLVYSKDEFEQKFKYEEHISKFYQKEIELNGQKFITYTNQHDKEKGCNFLTDKGCIIHEPNPIHCRVPLVKIKKVKNITFLTKEPYGRNWQFGCIAELSKELKVENFTKDEMNTLKRLYELSKEWNIKTWLPEIIEYLENVNTYEKKEFFEGSLTKWFQ